MTHSAVDPMSAAAALSAKEARVRGGFRVSGVFLSSCLLAGLCDGEAVARTPGLRHVSLDIV